ncbi:hypothetical protein D3C72_1855140 [compost metagenome]
MSFARLRVGRPQIFKVIERLMMILKIRCAGEITLIFAVVQRVLPTTGVPGPIDPFLAEQIANVRVFLWRHNVGHGGIRQRRIFLILRP